MKDRIQALVCHIENQENIKVTEMYVSRASFALLRDEECEVTCAPTPLIRIVAPYGYVEVKQDAT